MSWTLILMCRAVPRKRDVIDDKSVAHVFRRDCQQISAQPRDGKPRGCRSLYRSGRAGGETGSAMQTSVPPPSASVPGRVWPNQEQQRSHASCGARPAARECSMASDPNERCLPVGLLQRVEYLHGVAEALRKKGVPRIVGEDKANRGRLSLIMTVQVPQVPSRPATTSPKLIGGRIRPSSGLSQTARNASSNRQGFQRWLIWIPEYQIMEA
jgi:hypothetical protein